MESESGLHGTHDIDIAAAAEELKGLFELLGIGAITQEEYDGKKAELLGLPRARACMKCGAKLAEDAKFCITCGEKVT